MPALPRPGQTWQRGAKSLHGSTRRPVHGIDLGAHVDGVGFEALGLGGDDDAVALLSAGMLAKPLLRSRQAAGEGDGIAACELAVDFARGDHFALQHQPHELAETLGAEGAHRGGQVQRLVIDHGVAGA